jgi:hypothetical protein
MLYGEMEGPQKSKGSWNNVFSAHGRCLGIGLADCRVTAYMPRDDSLMTIEQYGVAGCVLSAGASLALAAQGNSVTHSRICNV